MGEYLGFIDSDSKKVFDQICLIHRGVQQDTLDLYHEEINKNPLAQEVEQLRQRNAQIVQKYENEVKERENQKKETNRLNQNLSVANDQIELLQAQLEKALKKPEPQPISSPGPEIKVELVRSTSENLHHSQSVKSMEQSYQQVSQYSPPKPPFKPVGKFMSLNQVKKTIADIFSQKLRYDDKCFEMGLPRETMEQYMYTYFNKKYGLKNIVLD